MTAPGETLHNVYHDGGMVVYGLGTEADTFRPPEAAHPVPNPVPQPERLHLGKLSVVGARVEVLPDSEN